MLYAGSAVAVALAVYVLEARPFFVLGPPSQSGWTPIVADLTAMAVLAAVFGVGAILRPLASLAGATAASFLSPPTCLVPGPLEVIWVSWCLGTLARWVGLSYKFARRAIVGWMRSAAP